MFNLTLKYSAGDHCAPRMGDFYGASRLATAASSALRYREGRFCARATLAVLSPSALAMAALPVPVQPQRIKISPAGQDR